MDPNRLFPLLYATDAIAHAGPQSEPTRVACTIHPPTHPWSNPPLYCFLGRRVVFSSTSVNRHGSDARREPARGVRFFFFFFLFLSPPLSLTSERAASTVSERRNLSPPRNHSNPPDGLTLEKEVRRRTLEEAGLSHRTRSTEAGRHNMSNLG